MNKSTLPVDLFEYLDYRKFLRDWYGESKRSRAGVSFRTFSKRAGFRSTNFFKLVMEGKRNLTTESAAKCMDGLKLNKQERDFFQNLVFFNQAKTNPEKDFHYQHLLRSRKFNQLKPIAQQQYEYYSDWYHAAIRELVVSKEFDGTPEWLAKQFSPPITPAQAAKSIELLEKLGFIERNPRRGRRVWSQASSVISTGPEVASHVIVHYHNNLLGLAQEILATCPAERRDISTMTLGVVKGRLPQLKKEIQEFRQRILKLVSMDLQPEEVVQLNIQLFPLTEGSKTEIA